MGYRQVEFSAANRSLYHHIERINPFSSATEIFNLWVKAGATVVIYSYWNIGADLYVARGSVDLETVGALTVGDSVRVTGEAALRVTGRTESELLVWELDTLQYELGPRQWAALTPLGRSDGLPATGLRSPTHDA